MTKLLLNSIEACEALGISERKLWQLTHDRDVPHIRIGRSVRYPEAELRAWIERRLQPGELSGDAR